MKIACLDMEGVITPEIWIEFSKATNIPELKITTRDEPDYDKLMKYRINILREHGLGLSKIQEVISGMDLLPGALEFVTKLRENMQVIILSDTFEQFAMPLMKKLGYPTIFCNTLTVGDDGMIDGFKMRVEKSKLTTVKALQSVGFEIVSAGDSYNDLDMLKNSKVGILFRGPDQIKKDNPQLITAEDYDVVVKAFLEA